MTSTNPSSNSGPQPDPGAVFLNGAADTLNLITPQAMPQQTIQVGVFDCRTHHMEWMLETTYPAGTPDNKKEENGGYVPAIGVADINSYNVKYEFILVNKPVNFQLILSVPNAEGQYNDKPSTINTQGTLASISFNAQSFKDQRVVILIEGQHFIRFIRPRLQEQLGAFLVPYMLISIIYEPPGGLSSASYSEESHAGTVTSWGFARTSGLGQTDDLTLILDMIAGEAQLAFTLSSLPTGASVVKFIRDLIGEATVTALDETTVGTEGSDGTDVSIGHGYFTDAHLYPGQGDLFVVLYNVLFVYLASEGKVHLAPVAYSRADALNASEITATLPPAVAEKFLALDPMPAGNPPTISLGTTMNWQLPRTFLGRLNGAFASRFQYFGTERCRPAQGNVINRTNSDFSSTGTSEETTHTTLTKVTGLLASIEGYSDGIHSVTYSSSTQHIEGNETVATITLEASPDEDAFWVDIYYDTVFRTFLCVRAEQLSSVPLVAGSITDEMNRPLANQFMTLEIAHRRYNIVADEKGDFAFPIASLPKVSGLLVVGNTKTPIIHSGAPISGLKIKVPHSLIPSTHIGRKPIQ